MNAAFYKSNNGSAVTFRDSQAQSQRGQRTIIRLGLRFLKFD